eukprot:5840884-Amphidinium_carterae.3
MSSKPNARWSTAFNWRLELRPFLMTFTVTVESMRLNTRRRWATPWRARKRTPLSQASISCRLMCARDLKE